MFGIRIRWKGVDGLCCGRTTATHLPFQVLTPPPPPRDRNAPPRHDAYSFAERRSEDFLRGPSRRHRTAGRCRGLLQYSSMKVEDCCCVW